LPLLLLAIAAVQLVRRRDLSPGALALGFLAALLCLILPILLGLGLLVLIGTLGDAPQPWYAYPLPTRLALWVGAFLCGGLLAAGLGRRVGLWGLGLGAWLLWAVLALILSLALTGAAIILLVPTFVAALLVALVVLGGRAGHPLARESAFVLAAAVAGMICLPLALVFEVATGFAMSPGITLFLGLAVATLLPLLALPPHRTPLRRGLILAAAALLAVAVVAALLVPPYSDSHPQPVNVYHVTGGDTGRARWVSVPYDDATPLPLRDLFEAEAVPVFPWSGARYLVAEAEPTGAPAPTLDVLADELTGSERLMTLRLRSPRGAGALELWLPRTRLQSLSVAGHSLSVEPGDLPGELYHLLCYGRSCDGLEVRLQLSGADPVAALVADDSLGLPAGGARLLQARPSTATSYQEGDLTVLWQRIEF
ncbi:MAG: hypothetical protein PVJ34_19515, partial [Anaerolineae bacterium]